MGLGAPGEATRSQNPSRGRVEEKASAQVTRQGRAGSGPRKPEGRPAGRTGTKGPEVATACRARGRGLLRRGAQEGETA